MAGSPLATGLERASLEGAGAVVVLGLNPKSLSIRRNTQWQAPANRSPSAASPASAAVVSLAGPVPVGPGQLVRASAVIIASHRSVDPAG